MAYQIKAHIIHENGTMLAKPLLTTIPRIGEEIRLPLDRYYTVTVVCWVLDEPECPFQRVNIGVRDFKSSATQQANTEQSE